MEQKFTIEISETVKNKIDNLVTAAAGNTDIIINNLIEKNGQLQTEINRLTEQCKKCSKKQIEALAIGDAISDGIYVTDRNGIVIAVNKGYSEITGVKENEILGRHINTVWKEKGFDSDTAFMELKKVNEMSTVEMLTVNDRKIMTTRKPRAIALLVLEEKKEISVITTIERNNKTVLITGKPFFDEQGEISQVLTLIRDLTELISLKEKLEEAEKEKKEYLNELKYFREKQLKFDLIGESPSMSNIKQLIQNVSSTDATVLITGKTGSGKEVVAREIYKNSLRKNGPYIKINCAAIPESLLESELFGYEKGAFTGAGSKEKLGMFEMANHGTILLDEIGEMPLKLQSKLLRVLQEKEITRVGATSPIKLDVRVIAATNQNLLEQIKSGSFRQDLYYRLNVIPIKIPCLKERREDITLLSHNFLEKFNKKYTKTKDFQTTALEELKYYDWPGNVRELENVIERLVVIGDDNLITRNSILNILGRDAFSNEVIDNDELTLKDAVDLFEKEIIEKALKKHGSTYKAAKVLGIAQPTVVRKAKALGIETW